jgi:hypothetical protein
MRSLECGCDLMIALTKWQMQPVALMELEVEPQSSFRTL